MSYGFVKALWEISFEAEKGKITAFLGANGAGKSTILNTVSGLVKPQSGLIYLGGRLISNHPPHSRVSLGLCLVPEGRKIFPYSTVKENLELGAYVRRAREKISDSFDWVFQLFPVLRQKINQLAGTMSGGEQQMLAIARGLMSRPDFLMIDETSLGLAPAVVTHMFETLRTIRNDGITILLVEQNVEVLDIADNVYLLEAGKVVAYGDSETMMKDEKIRSAYLAV